MKKKILLAFVLVCGLLALFHRPLLVAGAKMALRHEGVVYQAIYWDKGGLCADGVSSQGFKAEQIRLSFSLERGPLALSSLIAVQSPHLTLPSGTKGAYPLPLPFSFFECKWQAEGGVFELPDGVSLFFSLTAPSSRNGITALSLCTLPGAAPFLTATLAQEQRMLELQVHCEQTREEVRQLEALLKCLKLPQHVEGTFVITAGLRMDRKGQVHGASLSGQADGIDMLLFGKRFAADRIEGAFTYSPQEGPFWDGIECDVRIHRGKVDAKEWRITGIDGSVYLEKGHDPCLALGAVITSSQYTLPLTLDGKGRMEADGVFWLETALSSFPDQGKKWRASLTGCQPEQGKEIWQIEGERIPLGHLRVFQEILFPEIHYEWKFIEGNLSGMCSLHYQEGQWSLAQAGLTLQEGLVPMWGISALDAHIDSTPELPCRLQAEFLSDRFPQEGRCTLFGSLVPNPHVTSEYEWLGECQIAQVPLHWGATLLAPSFSSISTWEWKEGWVQADCIRKTLYTPWVKKMFPELQVSGDFALLATLKSHQLSLSLETEGMEISHPQFSLQTGSVCRNEQGQAVFLYTFSNQKWVAQVPLHSARISQGKAFAELATVLYWEDANWSMEGNLSHLHYPLTERVSFEGKDVSFTFDSENTTWEIGKGRASLILADGAPSYDLLWEPITYQQKQKLLFDVSMQDRGKTIGRAVGKALAVSGLWDVSLHPDKTTLFSQPLCVKELILNSDLQPVRYDIEPVLSGSSLLPIVTLYSHFFSLDPEIIAYLQTWQADLALHLFSSDARSGMHFALQTRHGVPPIHLQGYQQGSNWYVQSLHIGDVELACRIEQASQGWFVHDVKGKWQTIEGRGKGLFQKGIFTCQFDARGEIPGKGTLQAVSHLQWNTKTAEGVGEGSCSLTTKDLQLRSDPKIFFTYTSSGTISAAQSPSFQIYQKRSQAHVGKVVAKSLTYNVVDQHVRADDVSFSLSSSLLPYGDSTITLPAYLEGEGTWSSSPQHTHFQGTIKDGHYSFGTYPLPLEKITLIYDGTVLNLRCRSKIGTLSCLAQAHIHLKTPVYGMIHLQENGKTEGIKALFKTESGKTRWDSIQGSAFGLTCQLLGKKDVLTGKVGLDGTTVISLLPTPIADKLRPLEIGQGYIFQGDIRHSPTFQVRGKLGGSQVGLLGYTFAAFEGSLAILPQKIELSQIKITDPACQISCKQLHFLQAQPEAPWSFSLPLLQIQGLHPSRMQRQDGTTSELKPFRIATLNLAAITGITSQVDTWQGKGALRFTNEWKKETSLFDAPLDLIKNLGIDPGLFTPVCGEVDLELHGDKFYLVHLKNAFSEGKRAQFFLDPEREPSYVDLDGKIHIDVQMKQDVVLKLTEAFVLTMRGSLAQPRYGVRIQKVRAP